MSKKAFNQSLIPTKELSSTNHKQSSQDVNNSLSQQETERWTVGTFMLLLVGLPSFSVVVFIGSPSIVAKIFVMILILTIAAFSISLSSSLSIDDKENKRA